MSYSYTERRTKVSGRTGDQRVTTCSVCRCGIFTGQARVWSTSPMGLVHTGCAG